MDSGVPLESQQGSQSLYQVEEGTSDFLSSYDRDIRDPHMCPQERPVSMRVVRGLSGFLSSQCQVLIPRVDSRPEPEVSSPVLTWILGFF